jgi:hypothetical protein
MDKIEVRNICPLVETYEFQGKCTITTCQNHTVVTCSGCLMLDRNERSDSSMTDSEILHYKLNPNKEKFSTKTLDVKAALNLRKYYELRARNNILFFLYVEFVRVKHKPHPKFDYVEGVSPTLDSILSVYPFNQKVINFQPWMLVYLLNVDTFDEFVRTEHRFDASSSSISGLLSQTPGKYRVLKDEVRSFHKQQKQKSRTLLKRT